MLLDQRFWGTVCEGKGIGIKSSHIENFEGVCLDFANGALDPADPKGWQATAANLTFGGVGDGVTENVDMFDAILTRMESHSFCVDIGAVTILQHGIFGQSIARAAVACLLNGGPGGRTVSDTFSVRQDKGDLRTRVGLPPLNYQEEECCTVIILDDKKCEFGVAEISLNKISLLKGQTHSFTAELKNAKNYHVATVALECRLEVRRV
jgi:hypothetical protein